MKLIFLPAVALAGLAISSFSIGASANLLPEGTFEILDGKGQPEGWKLPDPNWSKNFGGRVTVEEEEGGFFLRTVCGLPEKLLASSVEVILPAGTHRVRVAYRVRAEVVAVGENSDGSGVGVAAIRWWGNAEKAQAKFGGADWILESTGGWQEKDMELEVPAGMDRLQLQIGTKSTQATADFDDVLVEVVE